MDRTTGLGRDARRPRRHRATGNGHVPRHELLALQEDLRGSDDQWATCLEVAARHVGPGHDSALATAITREIAISMVTRLAMESGYRLRVLHGWDLVDDRTAMTIGEVGFVTMTGVDIDGTDVGLVMLSEEALETDPWSGPVRVISHRRIFRAEILFDRSRLQEFAKA